MAYQSEIEKLTRRWNESPEQYFAPLADAYRKAGDLELALDVVRAGLEKRPNYVSAHIVLGRCYLDQKNDVEAGRAFQKVLEFDAENIIALRMLGEISERTGDPAGAHQWVKRLLEVDPMNEDAQEALQRLAPAAGEPVTPAESPPVAAAPPPRPSVAPFEPTVAASAPEPAPAAGPSPEEPGVVSSPMPPEDTEITLETVAPGGASDLGLERGEAVLEPSDPMYPLEPELLEPVPGRRPPGDELELEEELTLESSPSAELGLEQATEAMSLEDQPLAPLDLGPAEDSSPSPSASPSPAEASPSRMQFESSPAAPLVGEPPVTPAPEPAAPAAPSSGSSGAVNDSTSLHAASDLPLILPEPEESAVAPAPAARQTPGAGAEPEPVITETMAEVYLKQGLVREARDVYRQLLRQRPTDARLRARLESLEPRVSPAKGTELSARAKFGAAETGGRSARSVLAAVLSARPGAARTAPAAEPETPMEQAFADEPDPPAGAPTRPTGDDLSLAAVFGEEPAPAARPDLGAEAAPPSDKGGFSFDEFFGSQKPQTPPPSAPASPEESEGGSAAPSDFLSWLKGLKS